MAEPVLTLAAVFTAVGKAAIACLPGAAGAAVSLKFLGDNLTMSQKLISFMVGFACAVFIGPAVVDFFHMTGPRVQTGIEFLIGLFALATCRELFTEINNADIIGALKRRYLGGGQ
ncbi:holin [Massilia sp. TSP1-1-2]|uniref:holin n=1 Tax=Massilia sp. TSP1-1-2 TaxID=2804649 RepID=UPI003CE76E1D